MKKILFSLVSVVAPALLLTPLAATAKELIVTSVFSETGSGYARERLPDGSFKREYYAIADGGYSPGEGRDQSIDQVKFPALAGLVAEFLAGRNYYFANDAKSADLLLVISWGTTKPSFESGQYQLAQDQVLNAMNAYKSATIAAAGTFMSVEGIQSPEAAVRDAHLEELHSQLYQMQLFDDMRMKADEQNAKLLGYFRDINYDTGNPKLLAGGGTAYHDLIREIEQPRYYVILAAYDFRAATQHRVKKLLWITRISIRAQGNQFDQDVPAMLASAARYFGRDSNGLIRRFRDGKVTIGEMKVVGYESGATPPKKPEAER